MRMGAPESERVHNMAGRAGVKAENERVHKIVAGLAE
jgi:hypothetical protein